MDSRDLLHNYNAGPSALPSEVKVKVVEAIEGIDGGPGILELSHRSASFDRVIDGAREVIRRLYRLPETHEVLFLQGGASLQFAMIALNLGTRGGFLTTGEWSRRALAEARKVAEDKADKPVELYSCEPLFTDVPTQLRPQDRDGQALDYIHLTSNNTIYGTQYKALPQRADGKESLPPFIVDASSDIFSREIDWSKVDLLYAGAQKNAGPSGVTIVIGRRELLRSPPRSARCPKILSYQTHAEKGSLYHTPNTLGIFAVAEVGRWVEARGGIEVMQRRSNERSQKLYQIIDKHEVYRGHASAEARSKMNVTFTVAEPRIESKLLQRASELNMWGLKGHRSVGGLRASLYNAVSDTSVELLCRLLENIAREG